MWLRNVSESDVSSSYIHRPARFCSALCSDQISFTAQFMEKFITKNSEIIDSVKYMKQDIFWARLHPAFSVTSSWELTAEIRAVNISIRLSSSSGQKEKLEEQRLKTELWRWEGREAGNTWTTVWCQTDLQLHADRDLLWMFPFPSDKEETSEENANMESQPGGALSLAAEETTHNTLPHICREERLWLHILGVMNSDFNHILLIKLKSRIFLLALKGTVHHKQELSHLSLSRWRTVHGAQNISGTKNTSSQTDQRRHLHHLMNHFAN